MAEARDYRLLHRGKNVTYYNVKIEQTDLEIGTHGMYRKQAVELVKKYRADIEGYIKEHPNFLTTLSPIPCSPYAPTIVKRMCGAADLAGVGPMAAVAGAISELVGRALLQLSNEVIVENGGDLYLKTNQERIVGVYAGDSPLSYKVGLKIKPEQTPLGICTSSGKIGHSLSLGKADAVVIVSKDGILADAMATAVGNLVKAPKDIQRGLDFAGEVPGVDGALIICEESLGAWGNVHLVRI